MFTRGARPFSRGFGHQNNDYDTKKYIDYVTNMGYTICILAQQGASSGDDPRDGAGSGVPRLRREPHRREVRIPTARPSRLGAGSRCGSGPTAGSRLRGSASENRHGGAPREVPVAPGQGGRASQARPKKGVRLSALHPPLIGGDGADTARKERPTRTQACGAGTRKACCLTS